MCSSDLNSALGCEFLKRINYLSTNKPKQTKDRYETTELKLAVTMVPEFLSSLKNNHFKVSIVN